MPDSKYNTYINLLKTRQDKYGFIETDTCDSLGFTSLLGCVPETNISITAAFDSNTGMWHRRPLNYPECCPESSASTISKDMFVMLAWYIYFNKRLDLSEQIINYALNHWLVMGEADTFKDKIGRCLLSPGLLATFCEISYRLGGPNRWLIRNIPNLEDNKAVDFEAHLSVLHILLRNRLTNKFNNSDILQAQAKREPNNPLFAFAAGYIRKALKLLDNNKLWPEDRLPTTADRFEQWLPQRGEGKDWAPSEAQPPKVHSGADYLFLIWLINNY
jgi:hypothetical protein